MNPEPSTSLSLRWRIEPPVSLVTDGAVDVAVLFSLNRKALTERAAVPLDLALALVGKPRPSRRAEQLAAFERIAATRGPNDTLQFIGANGPTDDIASVFADPAATLANALSAGARALAHPANGPNACRLIVLVNTPVAEPMDDLLNAATALSEHAIGADLACAHASADLGLLTRLANLGGGEVCLAEPQRTLGEALVDRVNVLRDQRLLDAQLELTFSPIIQPGQLFRVDPTPVFLRNVRLNDGNRQLTVEIGPVTGSGRDPCFLLTAVLPKRRIGRYRLFDARLYAREAGDRPLWSGGVVQRCGADPLEASEVEAEVITARERVEGTAWAEEVARAYAEGDARRVSSLLDRLTRHFVTLGRERAVEQIAAMRVRFLRSGSLSRVDVNRLRRLASLPEF